MVITVPTEHAYLWNIVDDNNILYINNIQQNFVITYSSGP